MEYQNINRNQRYKEAKQKLKHEPDKLSKPEWNTTLTKLTA